MNSKISDWKIDNTWTLFLDRDGVINRRIVGDYVKTIGEFEFLAGSRETIVELSFLFGKIIVVTNQQGIGKGYYTHDDLLKIHDHMTAAVEADGGKIDMVFYAPQLSSENSPMRKPGIGMALEAKKIFPEIEFGKSIMVGDSASDMEFGKRAGMRTVFVGKPSDCDVRCDGYIEDLSALCRFLNGL